MTGLRGFCYGKAMFGSAIPKFEASVLFYSIRSEVPMKVMFYSTSVAAFFFLPALAACQASGDQKPVNREKGLAGDPVVYRVSDKLSVIDNGDTITWIVTRPSMTKPDTAVFVFKGDSALRIRPAPVTPVSAAEALRIKRIREQLKKIREMDEDVAKLSK